MIEVAYGAATDVGRVRQENEDAFLAEPPVFAVADGMGGHAGGQAASRVAVEELGALVRHDDLGPAAVRQALVAADERVRGLSGPDGVPLGAGTTATALLAVRDEAGPAWLVVNLGDSRAYRYADGGLTQVSTDHSLVQEMVDEGLLSPQDARHHPQRNVITRALGGAPDVDPDLWIRRPHLGERWLLCSDGLTNELEDEAVAAVLAGHDEPQAAADALVRQAVEAGGHDNVTVVVVDVVG